MSGSINSCGSVNFRSNTRCSCSSRCRTGSIACFRCIGGGVGSGVRNGVGDCNSINMDYIKKKFLVKFVIERFDSLIFITCHSQVLLSSECLY